VVFGVNPVSAPGGPDRISSAPGGLRELMRAIRDEAQTRSRDALSSFAGAGSPGRGPCPARAACVPAWSGEGRHGTIDVSVTLYLSIARNPA